MTIIRQSLLLLSISDLQALNLVGPTMRDPVSKMIMEEDIDICCLQEIDILPEVNHELLSFKVI